VPTPRVASAALAAFVFRATFHLSDCAAVRETEAGRSMQRSS
jgi:hypothetical protein